MYTYHLEDNQRQPRRTTRQLEDKQRETRRAANQTEKTSKTNKDTFRRPRRTTTCEQNNTEDLEERPTKDRCLREAEGVPRKGV